ncbi:hypothetical protein D6851_10590 [Altericroceibacterium spongiae]|uniref:Phage gp6-like head-tail connector protein n=1 Tax=Altericroceibacterium spongiae TaxID=2320269 RepID=A0A420EJH5_9SPHN|nr:hypothetical protein [Altericroceibacterium spongiae]RKF20810.1 hypothetical protein D6851_10590 [Altericroceibacterium spongiae]
MKRVIVTRPDLSGSALGELKDWLAITAGRDDATLEALLHSACDMCEGFTGLMPLENQCEEVHPAAPPGHGGWRSLATHPVSAITQIRWLADDGSTRPLEASDYRLDLGDDGCGLFRLTAAPQESRIVIRFTAGLAPGWTGLPDGMRHGILRLAAHLYRQRDRGDEGSAPPLAIAALWRPWRRMRLA